MCGWSSGHPIDHVVDFGGPASDRVVLESASQIAGQIAVRTARLPRSKFGGTSSYAPDLVLINEFTKEEFLQAVHSESSKLVTDTKAHVQTIRSGRVDEAVEQLSKSDSKARILFRKNDLAIVELHSRSATFLAKSSSPILKIYAVKSLDDAIDLFGFHATTPAAAAYHFGKPATGKYLSQFIPAERAFINHIPRELLLGPAIPTGRHTDSNQCYSTDCFTLNRPVYIEAFVRSEKLVTVLGSHNSDIATKLTAEATTPLKAFKRNPGSGVGFFEQGFLYNAGLILASTLTVSATGAYWLWKYSRPV
ncbi:putative aldehyde/histidinol dehydrogenase [Septoria linicola]|nr:putative aldehyde/histidinol dehydrogenase [Septoria linicola]